MIKIKMHNNIFILLRIRLFRHSRRNHVTEQRPPQHQTHYHNTIKRFTTGRRAPVEIFNYFDWSDQGVQLHIFFKN